MRKQNLSKVVNHVSAATIAQGPYDVGDNEKLISAIAADSSVLREFGLGVSAFHLNQMAEYSGMSEGAGMDAALTAPLTDAATGVPVQFLQEHVPGMVRIVTSGRQIDMLTGMTTMGSFEDDEIVQMIQEATGQATEYSDHANSPVSSYNTTFDRTSIVRFEASAESHYLQSARAARINVDDMAESRYGASEALEITRNMVAFFGYNNGQNRTYGFLNDPNLPAYVNVATGASGQTTWVSKDYHEIIADIITAIQALEIRLQNRVNIRNVKTVLALPTGFQTQFSKVSTNGKSIWEWLNESYPNMRIETAPELNNANGNAEVFYLYVETVPGSGTDNQMTWRQAVPAKMQMLGTEQKAKGVLEAYAMATGGARALRPYAIVRYSGI